MLGFVYYLIEEKGYIPYRNVYKNKEWVFVKENIKRVDFYSSMGSGNIDIRFIKPEDVSENMGNHTKQFVYGLNEAEGHKPPTLIYPRLTGILYDYEMNRYFENHTFEEIYNECIKNFK